MADNSMIKLTASLDTNDISQIKADIETISKKLKTENVSFKVQCSVSQSDISALQRQFSQITPTLKVNVDLPSNDLIQKNAARIKSQLNSTLKNIEISSPRVKVGKATTQSFIDSLGLEIPRDGHTREVKSKFQELIQEYQKVFQTGNEKDINNAFENLYDYAKKFEKEVVVINQDLADTQNIIKGLIRGSKPYIDDSIYGDLKVRTDGGQKSFLTSLFGTGWGNDSSKQYKTSWDELVREINQQAHTAFKENADGLLSMADFLNTDVNLSEDFREFFDKNFSDEIERSMRKSFEEALHNALGIKIPEADGLVDIFDMNELQEETHALDGLSSSVKNVADNAKILENAKEYYRSLFDVSDKDVSAKWVKDANDDISRLNVTVREGSGIVETFSHTVDEMSNLSLLSITGSDKEIAKINQYISNTEKKLEEFKSVHSSILWGVQEPLKNVSDNLNDLKSGEKSIDDVESSFNVLKKTVAEAEKHFKSANASLNIDNNAINKANNFENILKSIQIEADSLNKSPIKDNIAQSLSRIKDEGLKNLSEAKDKGDIKLWGEIYESINKEIQDLTNNLQVAKKEDSLFNKEFAKSLKEEEKEVNAFVNKIKNNYNEIAEYKNKRLRANNENEIRFYDEVIDRLQREIVLEKTRLQNKGLLTKDVEDRISPIEKKYETKREEISIKATNKETGETKKKIERYLSEVNKELNDETNRSIKQIEESYNKIIKLQKKNLNADDRQRQSVNNPEIARLREVIQLEEENLKTKGLLTKKVKEQVKVIKEKYDFEQKGLLSALTSNAESEGEKQLEQRAKKIEALKREINVLLNRANSQLNNVAFRNNSTDADVINKVSQLESFKKGFLSISSDLGGVETAEDLERVEKELNRLTPSFNLAIQASKQLQSSLKKDSFSETLVNRIKKLSAEMAGFATQNKKAIASTQEMSDGVTFANKWEDMTSRMAKGSELTADELRHLTEEFRYFSSEATAAGLKGETATDSLLGSFKKMFSYLSAQEVFNFTKRQIAEMTQEVIDLDSAMTDLKKVTDASDDTYKDFIKTSQKQAEVLHTTTTDVVEQSAEWAKLGYDMKQAQSLSKVSTIYSKVGEVDNKTAVQDLVSTMKAFNIEADEGITIVDALNKLGNEFSTDAGSLGEGLKRSASAMSVAGNDFAETLALLTGGAEITQNADEMGNALKIISLRLRGMKGELEELGEETEGIESISKIQTQILNLTKNKVNIFNDNGSFKSTYEILKEVAKIYYSLSDTSRASITEIMFGKNRANQGIALLQAFQSGQNEAAYKAVINSAGSAQKEFDQMSESIVSHINDFKQAYNELSTTIVDGGLIKTVVDNGTNVLKLINTITEKTGVLTPLLSSVVGIGAIKGRDFFAEIKTMIESTTKSLVSGINEISAINKGKFSGINFLALSKDEITDLRECVALISQGKQNTIEFDEAIAKSSGKVRIQADSFKALKAQVDAGTVSEKTYMAATNALSLSQKAATITTNILKAALSSMAVVAIGAAITALIKLANAEEEAKKAAKESREQAVARIEATESETKTVNDLATKYSELYTSTENYAIIKQSLQDLQNEIVEKYGEEAKAIDLVNGKYSENLDAFRKMNEEKAKNNLESNAVDIKRAEDAYYKRTTGEKINVGDEFAGIVKGKIDNLSVKQSGWGGSVTAVGNINQQLEALKKLREEYLLYDNQNEDVLKRINEQIESLAEEKNQVDKLIKSSKEGMEILNIPNEVKEEFDSLADEAVRLKNEIENSNDFAQKYADGLDLKNVMEDMTNLVEKNAGLKDSFDMVSTAIGNFADNSIEEVGDLRTAWFDNMDKMQKDTFKEVQSIETAMQTLAEGNYLSSADFWDIAKIDKNDTLTDIKMVGSEYALSQEQLIKLKDAYIQKQKQSIQLSAEEIVHNLASSKKQAEIIKAEMKKLGNDEEGKAQYSKLYSDLVSVNGNIKEYESELRRCNLLVAEWNSHLGDTVNLSKKIETQQKAIENQQKVLEEQQKALNNELEKAQKNADSYANAMTKQVESVINRLEKEKTALEDEKSILDEQLNTLEKQQETIQSTIEQYKQMVDMVKSETDKEIDILKEQQKSEEEAIQAKIDALKKSKEEQETANDLAERQLDLQQKLADLEKAKQNKVRTYSSEKGWHYASDKEVIANAETALDESQKAYDKAINDKLYNEQLEALENQKTAVTENFEAQIKSHEDFYEQWKEIIDEQTNAENEQLANEILGAEWREKIKNKDIDILNKFKANFKSYNNQLNALVNGEIAALKQSIQAKEEEIKAKEGQIKSWQDYQTQVNETVNNIKGKYDEYLQYLGEFNLSEASSLEERQAMLNSFAQSYEGMIDDMNNKELSLENVQNQISTLAEQLAELQGMDISISPSINTDRLSDEMLRICEAYQVTLEAMNSMAESLEESSTGYGVVNSASDAKIADAANEWRKIKGSYATGGIIDYTGRANVHGKPQSSEVVFNSGQARSLYDMVRTGGFSSVVAEKAIDGLRSVPFANSADNSTRVININGMTIKADNPTQFHEQFMKEIGQYWQIKLTETRVY